MFKVFAWLFERKSVLLTGFISQQAVVKAQEESRLIKKYKRTGSILGSMIFDCYVGHAVEYSATLDRLIKLEAEVANEGYMPVPIFLFSRIQDITAIVIPYRSADEEPIFYAALWKKTNTEDLIFSNESLFQNETQTEHGISLEVNPESNKIFEHERLLLNGSISSFIETA